MVAAASSAAASIAAAAPPTQTSAPAATVQAAGASTALDPCALVPAAEASRLAGVTYGPGIEETLASSSKRCTYGSQTLNVFTVESMRAQSSAAAQAAWSQEQAQAQAALQKQVPAGLKVSWHLIPASGLGDRAATVSAGISISGQTVAISGTS